jgi:hypothetical protein
LETFEFLELALLLSFTAADASINVYRPHIVASAGDVIGSDAYLRVGGDGGIDGRQPGRSASQLRRT